MDKLLVEPKVGGMVDLVLEKDASDSVLDEGCGLHGVCVVEEEIGVEAALHDAQHEECSPLHGSVADDTSPEAEGVRVVVVLGGGFLVFTVAGFKDPWVAESQLLRKV